MLDVGPGWVLSRSLRTVPGVRCSWPSGGPRWQWALLGLLVEGPSEGGTARDLGGTLVGHRPVFVFVA